MAATFLEKISAAWLDAAVFSDTKANACKEDNRNDFEVWDHRADRYDALAKLVRELSPATAYKPLTRA